MRIPFCLPSDWLHLLLGSFFLLTFFFFSSIVDDKHAWVMDVIGRGADKLGAIWVARKVPDGSILGKVFTLQLISPLVYFF